ncbi:hypothetical protein [Corynebacterium liangguodongii]|uniref:Uncharacterized protein n=1 Tax=Corynebacterium liangguodongii TaxID=2079535 RepID=A0A2S0WGA6_9CORY|nr:hypothetical protein [Corynebacterium liangguodongii]AWB84807.1 hypothetical protein C3E79_10245 [Corynebacterium liangguodongii]PWB99164.1 hypothetical protein DF219_07860 [Corynebacterium liangguodongii]
MSDRITPSKLTENDVEMLKRIAWEGGAFEALEYGIEVGVFERPELKRLWEALSADFASFRLKEMVLEALIEEIE